MITFQEPVREIQSNGALPGIEPLSAEEYRELVRRRALTVLHMAPNEGNRPDDESARRETEKLILEKVNGGSNLLPVDFLTKGVERAKAVCRIMTPGGPATGFLIEHGILMTNHHVIADARSAELSFAEFGYEEQKVAVKVKLKPAELFITSPENELDFTIVACETEGLGGIVPVSLLRNPMTIIRGEFVNIIQHPRGRKKELALQENTVTYVYDKAIYYSTDTEEGSSGSAVFNNDWQLVALHKGSKEEEAVNVGVRISAIVAKLVAMAQAGDAGAGKIIRNVEDSSPYLGFYDVAGLVSGQGDLAEIEIPTYKGDKRFADIGFWNIERFDHTVKEERIRDAARIINDLHMDALGLTEVDKAALDRLLAALREKGAMMDYVLLETEGHQDLAVLYDKATTAVELRSDINRKYSSLLNAAIAGRPAFPNGREPLFALCTVKEEGRDIQFLMIVVHLKAMRDEISIERRKLAAQALSVIIEDLKRDEAYSRLPIMLGGDMNDDAGSVSLAPIMNADSLITLTADDAQAGHLSYVKPPYSLIDHIVISKDMKVGSIEGDDAAIVRLDRGLRDFVKRFSDHVPLVLRVIYKDETDAPERREELQPAAFIPTGAGADTPERTILKLRLNRERPDGDAAYYDEAKDIAAVERYYEAVNFQSGDGAELFHVIHRLLLGTHSNILSYDRSRAELYSNVDLRPDGKLRSIYSGRELDADRIIVEDYRLRRQKEQFLESLLGAGPTDEKEIAAMLEAKFQFNTEHIVPQSWFFRRSPMVSDLHHLFTCEAACNSFRGNIPYYDFADYNPEAYREITRTECGKRGGNERFEPESGKGEAARAVLYFLLRYPGKVGDDLMLRFPVDTLLDWHKKHPVSVYEKHRNMAIFELQGNRNPLIDFPDFADRIDYLSGP